MARRSKRLLLLTAACAACVSMGEAAATDIVRIDTDSYKIALPTCEVRDCRDPQKLRDRDDIRQELTQYGARMKKTMVVTGGSFDMGTGFTLIFKCIPP